MKKGTTYTCPKKRVCVPADVRALGNQGAAIASAIRVFYSRQQGQSRAS
jgi:hypothetical protein